MIVVTLIPLIAFVLIRLKFTGKTWNIPIWIAYFTVALLLMIYPSGIVRSKFAWLYCLFVPMYYLSFGIKADFNKPFRLIGNALLMVFFVANYWEIPVYVYGFLGIYPFTQWFDLLYQIQNVYMIATLWLLLKANDLGINSVGWFTLLTSLICSFCILWILPIDWAILARLVPLFISINFILFGLEKHE